MAHNRLIIEAPSPPYSFERLITAVLFASALTVVGLGDSCAAPFFNDFNSGIGPWWTFGSPPLENPQYYFSVEDNDKYLRSAQGSVKLSLMDFCYDVSFGGQLHLTFDVVVSGGIELSSSVVVRTPNADLFSEEFNRLPLDPNSLSIPGKSQASFNAALVTYNPEFGTCDLILEFLLDPAPAPGSGGLGLDNVSISIPADFELNGPVDGKDLRLWAPAFGAGIKADADGDSDSDGADFLTWQQNMGSVLSVPYVLSVSGPVPEPSGWALVLVGFSGPALRTAKKRP
jgi:hypothetical protein